MLTLRYILCDVFTDRALTGNQLAVFTDARRLTPATMQALAREMNFSESVFVLRPEAGGQARIRIFTPSRELPFAGHPTLGAAFVLGGPLQAEQVRLETDAGLVTIDLQREGARIVFGWMSQPIPKVAPFSESAALFAALGVSGSLLPVESYSLGPTHVYVALDTPAEVAALAPDFTALARVGDFGVNVFARTASGYKTRMFGPRLGVDEDAATGSAAGPLAVHLLRHGWLEPGQAIEIEQGVELRRPAKLYARVSGSASVIDTVSVGGAAVVIGRGEIRVRADQGDLID